MGYLLGSRWWIPYASLLLAMISIGVLMDSFRHYQKDVQGCDMSYSYPTYIPVKVPSRLTKYHLYLFRDASMDNPDHLQGMPALFVPGHAGSYKQARSIAAKSSEHVFHRLPPHHGVRQLDFFTVDFNEEFSALSGTLIEEQAEFLNDAVRHILSLYQHHDGSVIVVGHSMGGIAARLMPTLPNYLDQSVQFLLTIATPHITPPITLDPVMDDIYRHRLNKISLAIISIAGGTPDAIVNSALTRLPDDPLHFSVYSTAIPRVWTGCDHHATLWCNQLANLVGSALVTAANTQGTSLSERAHKRVEAFRQYIQQINTLETNTMIEIDAPAVIQHNPSRLHVRDPTLLTLDRDMTLCILSTSPLSPQDVMLCRYTSNGLTCTPTSSQLLPRSTAALHFPFEELQHPFGYVTVSPSDWHGYDGIYIAASTPVVADASSSEPVVKFPSEQELLWTGWTVSVSQLDTTIVIPRLHSSILSYRAQVTRRPDSSVTDATFMPLMRQTMGQDGETKFYVNMDTVLLHFYGDGSLTLQVWSPWPLEIHFQVDWYGSLGRWIIPYGPAMVVYQLALAVYIVLLQAQYGLQRGYARPVYSVLWSAWKRLAIVITVSRILYPSTPALLLGVGDTGGMISWILAMAMLTLGSAVIILLCTVFGVLLWPLQFTRTPASSNAKLLITLVTMGCLVPFSVVFASACLCWVWFTSRANHEHDKRFRFSVLVLFGSLLPYHVPDIIVYVRNIQAGWTSPPSWSAVASSLVLVTLIGFLIRTIHGRVAIHHRDLFLGLCILSQGLVWAYALYGVQHPFFVHGLPSLVFG